MITYLLVLPAMCTVIHGTNIAYIGPGTGLSVIGAVLAVGASIAVAIFGFFWYPIKRLLGKNKESQEPAPEIDEEQ